MKSNLNLNQGRLKRFVGLGFSTSVLALVLISGCKNPLDIKPPYEVPTEEALNTTQNLESALIGAYNAAVSQNTLGGGFKLYPDVVSDHLSANGFALARGNMPLNLQNMYRRLLFAVADGTWRSAYQAINRANNIIKAIDNGMVTNKDAVYYANVNRIKGEALFLRAVMHFELCRMYGVQYGEPGYDDPNGQRGVIISTEASENRNGVIRSSTKQVYDQVIADLRTAAALMPRETVNQSVDRSFLPTYGGRKGGRATKDAAWGYLARVFFQAGTPEYNDSALVYTNLILPAAGNTTSVRSVLDDYVDATGNQLPRTAKNPFNLRGFEAAKETIFQVVNTLDEATGTFNTSNGLLNSEYAWSAGNSNAPSYFLTSQKFFEQANYPAEGAVDLRANYFMPSVPENSSSGISCVVNLTQSRIAGKYLFRTLPAPYDANIGVINIIVLRQAELILTRAEINAYKGNLSDAIADINAIRRRAFGTSGSNYDIPASTNQQDLINIIKRERIRELACEGDRFYNLKRLARCADNGLPVGQRTDYYLVAKLISDPNRADRTQCDRILDNIDPNNNQLLFQIPDAELSSNPNIRRN